MTEPAGTNVHAPSVQPVGTIRYWAAARHGRLSVLAGFYRTCVIDGVLERPRPNTSGDRGCPLSPQPSD
jgi:hypothetical protein